MNVRDETIRKHDDRMANDEVLGPRKTMFILVIVVGCFAILWPRILSPLIVGTTKQQLQPNQFDRDAGCCEVMFGTELAVLELINEVCSSAHTNGKLNPYAAAECRRTVNETCGVDIAAFLKRTENVGKTSKILLRTMQGSNSSCLKEHFGVPVLNLGPHLAYNSWTFQDTAVKQERSPILGAGPHPALRERGRAIPAGAPPSPRGSQIQMPPHVRVRSPLEGYFEQELKPPPIPGMRPPLGSPGGPQAAPKSSMGFIMPFYTLCIIIFFVYTLSKIFFKSGSEIYEEVTPDPQFRRRVFRDDSRTTPDKFGHKEEDTIVSAISGLVAEVRQQMETSYAQNQQTQERPASTRPYTNGTVLHNSGPVHIIASEYLKEDPEPEETITQLEIKTALNKVAEEIERMKEEIEVKEVENVKNDNDVEVDVPKETAAEETDKEESLKDTTYDTDVQVEVPKVTVEKTDEKESPKEIIDDENEIVETEPENEIIQEKVVSDNEVNLLDLTEPADVKRNGDILSKVTADFIEEAKKADDKMTKELLEEALDDEEEYDEEEEDDLEPEKSSVKVVGMEVRAESADGGACTQQGTPQSHHHPPAAAVPTPQRTPHEAEEVQSIFLETEIPQKSRVLVDFEDDAQDQPPPAKHAPMVVSGKMTLSLIQDAPRDTPERDVESTVDDFTTASAVTQDAAEKDGSASEEEIEEEIEVEEIEEEVEEIEEEVEEEEENEEVKPKQPVKGTE